MPLYEYCCPGCGLSTEALRPIAERDVQFACNRCLTLVQRVISATRGTVKDPAVPKKIRNKSKHTSFSR